MSFAREQHEYGFWGGEIRRRTARGRLSPDRADRRARPVRELTGNSHSQRRDRRRRRRQPQPRPRGALRTSPGTGRDRCSAPRMQEFPGGKGLNQAVAAARRRGSRGPHRCRWRRRRRSPAHAVSARDAGIDVAGLDRSNRGPTGRAMIVVDDAGENSIVVVPGANATASTATDPQQPASCSLNWRSRSRPWSMRSSQHGRAEQPRCSIRHPPAGSPAALLATCDIVIPNEHEVDLDRRRRGAARRRRRGRHRHQG